MQKLVGHDLVYKELIRLFKNNILPKKILISGRSGIGKSLLVDKFINYIYSKNEEHFLIDNNVHPNIFKISKETEKKNIEISKIREMIQFKNHSSFNNNIRTIIIKDTEYLNTSSSNALLKSLEEQNEKILFILINNSENKIQDTLKSRCIEFKLNLKYDEIITIVDDYFNEKIHVNIPKDFKIFYNSPSFIIKLIEFFKDNSIEYQNITIENFIINLIKNKYYSKNQFILEHLNIFLELFFYKNIYKSKKISHEIKEYFYTKLSKIRKYNLDLETFFLEFDEKLLSE